MNRIEQVRDACGVVETRITWSVPLTSQQEQGAQELWDALESTSSPVTILESAQEEALDERDGEYAELIEDLEDKLQDYRITCAAQEKEIADLKAQLTGRTVAALEASCAV